MRSTRCISVLCAAAFCANTALARPFSDPRGVDDSNVSLAAEAADPACHASTLVSTGGAFPRNPHTLAIRWTGYSNFELAYGGEILLLDAYFDRGSTFAPLGFKAADKQDECHPDRSRALRSYVGCRIRS